MTNAAQQRPALQDAARDVLPLDPDGRVMQSVPCLECGYIVRGMAVTESCPECATPVARSLRSLLLRCADRTWLSMIRQGITLVAVFIVLNTLIPVDLIARRFQHDPFITLVIWFVMSFVTGLFILGQWMLTTAEPTGMLSRGEDHLRISIRVATAIAGASLWAHDALVTRAGLVIETLVITGTALSMLIATILTGVHVRGLTDRIPDAELRRASVVSMTGLVICLSSYMFAVLWMARSGDAIGQLRAVNVLTLLQQPYGDSTLGAVTWLIAIVVAIAAIGVVVITIGIRSSIREILQRVEYSAEVAR